MLKEKLINEVTVTWLIWYNDLLKSIGQKVHVQQELLIIVNKIFCVTTRKTQSVKKRNKHNGDEHFLRELQSTMLNSAPV